MHSIHRVREFHHVFGHPIAKTPTPAEAATRLLRFRLIFEEALEYGRAIGIEGLCESALEEFESDLKSALNEFKINPDMPVDLEGAADALGDLDYVVQGANLVHGFPAEEIVREIHAANMSKLGSDGLPIKDAFGKIGKGPNTRKPNLAPILARAKMG